METIIFYILPSLVAELKERFEELVKRAKKLGMTPPTLTVDLKDVITHSYLSNGNPKTCKKVKVVVSCDPVVINGWKVVGVIDLLPEGGHIIHTFDEEVTQKAEFYRHHAMVCDHCQTLRRRLKTVILRDGQGRMIQVGRNCLKDFVDNRSLDSLASSLSFYDELQDLAGLSGENEERLGGGGLSRGMLMNLWTVIALAIHFVRKLGYTRSQDIDEFSGKMPTRFHVDNAYWNLEGNADLNGIVEGDVGQKADQVIAWVRETMAKDPKPGYEANLVTLFQDGDYFPRSHLGLAVSSVASYDRFLGKMAEASKTANSRHLGTVASKLTTTVTITRCTPYNVFSRYNDGSKTAISMVDDNGNVLVWFASGTKPMEVGSRMSVTGTVQKHDSYKGVAQTVLARCKFAPVA